MPDLIKLGEMDIKILVLGMVSTNCYILSNHETKETIIIDPADKADIIKQYIKENDLYVVGIFLTHGHFDHILAANELTSYFHTKLYAGKEEKELLNNMVYNCSQSVGASCELSADVYLEDGDIITLAGFRMKVLHTPGHTAGGVCYYFINQGVLMSGDTLFFESIGRTDLPTGNSLKLIQSVRGKLFNLEDNTKVYPGHGNSTTIGYEKKNNPCMNGWE